MHQSKQSSFRLAKLFVLLLLSLLFVIPSHLVAAGTVSGDATISIMVAGKEGEEFVFRAAGFEVLFLDAENAVVLGQTTTDISGQFTSLLNPGIYKIRVSGRGFYPSLGYNCANGYYVFGLEGSDVFATGTPVAVTDNSTSAIHVAVTANDIYCPMACVGVTPYLSFSITDKDNPDMGISGIQFQFRDVYNALLADYEWQISDDVPGQYEFAMKNPVCGYVVKGRLVDPTGTYMPEYLGAGQSDVFDMGTEIDLRDCGSGSSCSFPDQMVKITPPQQLSNLLEEIGNADFPPGVQQSLTAILGHAHTVLMDTNSNNDQSACGLLSGFIGQLKGKVTRGELTQESATALEVKAVAVMSQLGCS